MFLFNYLLIINSSEVEAFLCEKPDSSSERIKCNIKIKSLENELYLYYY